jgi:hypothetical protein
MLVKELFEMLTEKKWIKTDPAKLDEAKAKCTCGVHPKSEWAKSAHQKSCPLSAMSKKEIEKLTEADEELEALYAEYLGEDQLDEEQLDEKQWSGKVTTKWSPPEGFFSQSADKIAKGLHAAGAAKAMSRLNFYINRAGSHLSAKDKARLEDAKRKLHAMYESVNEGLAEDEKDYQVPSGNQSWSKARQ